LWLALSDDQTEQPSNSVLREQFLQFCKRLFPHFLVPEVLVFLKNAAMGQTQMLLSKHPSK
jgi:hypothetical protein